MNDNRYNMIFANNLVNMLAQYGMTRAELAKRMNVSAQSVTNWCKGDKVPRMDKVDTLCSLFNCRRSDLIEDKSSAINKNNTILRSDEKALLESYNSLNEVGRGKVLEYATDLSEQAKYTAADEEKKEA